MKRSIPFRCLLLGTALFLTLARAGAQSIVPAKESTPGAFAVTAKVDERVELMSIVARLAGYEEYTNNQFKMYADDVDTYFAEYKEHPAVQFAHKIRNSNSIAFDAVMAMAVHLHPPPALTPVVPFTDQVPDPRWGKDTANQFVRSLQQFYQDTNFEEFFRSHADLYYAAEQHFQLQVNKVDFDWYQKFYGEVPQGSFNVCIGLLNGGGNYGPKVVYPDGREDRYAIIGTWQVDEAGLPVFRDNDIVPTIIHEYNHSFMNHLVSEHEEELSTAGEKISRPVTDKMKILAYSGWQTTLDESLVRTAVIRYEFDHGATPEATYQAILRERNLGFLWTEELYALLGTYENSRRNYPTFRSFFPLIVGYFDDFSHRVDYTEQRFEEMAPRVVGISPILNGAQDVDPNTTQLTFTFDKPLDSSAGYSFNASSGGDEHFPGEFKAAGYGQNGSTFTILMKLKPDWEYEFVLTGRAFRSKDDYPLQPYTVKFKTRKQ